MKPNYIFVVSFVFYIFSAFNLAAFEPDFFKKLPASLDISHQSIRAITQDQDGFIWLGTHESLSRFDGYQLVSYHHNPDDKNSLSHNVISSLLTDSKGRLWIGTRGGGVNLFQPNSNSFTRFVQHGKQNPLSNNNITLLFEDSKGSLWIGTEQGLNKLNNNNKVSENIATELSDISVRALIEVNNQLWVGTENEGIYVYSLSGKLISKLTHSNENPHSIPSNIIRALLHDTDGNIWIGTVEGGLSRYQPLTGTFKHFKYNSTADYSLASNIVTTLFQDSDSRIWVGTDKGLNLYNDQTQGFQSFIHANHDINSLSNNTILNIFEDKGKMIWLGTFSGLNRWDPNVATFKQFTLQNKSGLNNNSIHKFAQLNSNQILVATYGGGVNVLDLDTLNIEQPKYNQYLNDKRIMAILNYDNDIWLGTRASGVFRINKKTEKITHYQHNDSNPMSLSANSITDIKVDNQGVIWVATYHGGLNRFEGEGFSHYRASKSTQSVTLSTDRILQILPDKNHSLWLATDGGGLNKLNTKTGDIQVYKHEHSNNRSLSSDVAWTLFLDSKDNLWVGTEANGLNLLVAENKAQNIIEFKHININHGMKTSTVFGLTEDDKGTLWMITNKGVSRYFVDEKRFVHFNTSHGLLDLEYNFQAILKTQNNQLLFGSAKGFNMLNPDKLLSNQHAPQVQLTDIYSLNTKLKFDKPLSQLKQIEFDYTDKLIAFEYTGLDFASPESNQFKYRLQGFDKEWIEAGKLRRATYTNLAAGEYQLQIRAANNFGVWGEADVNLKIKVHPAPWNTWWAYVLYASLLALLLLMYSRIMTRKLVVEQQQRLKLKSEVYEKTQEFKNQNIQLVALNQKLEASAITDKLTGAKSRRYLDIYIEQTSRLMTQIHQNISPAQQSLLPRLFLMLIKVESEANPSDRILINVAEYLGYKCAEDDLVVRWSDNIFAIIGSEKDNNVSLLAQNLAGEQDNIALENASLTVGYSFFPFNRERPQELSWDHTSIIAEVALNNVQNSQWLGIYQPIEYPFNYNQLVAAEDIRQIKQLVTVKHS